MSVRRMTVARASMVALMAFSLAACGSSSNGDSDTAGQQASAGDTQSEDTQSEDTESAGGGDLSGDIAVDGSSTVTPLTEAAAELFMAENPGVRIAVGTSGTGGGFDKFCNGETDISMASRNIKAEEEELCASNGIEFEELGVANDGLAIVVNPNNDWATCMTVDELSAAWQDGSTATTWADLNPAYPDEPIELYGPGTDSGTFDYFTEAINGEEGSITQTYNDIGEDDNAAVIGVTGSNGAMAFIPLSYVSEAGDQVKAIEVENEAGECVAPTEETVQAGDYNPLGRQLYIYPSAAALEKPEVLAFVQFHVENSGPAAKAAGFIGLTDEQAQVALDQVHSLTGGR